jgi:hypothetical protein
MGGFGGVPPMGEGMGMGRALQEAPFPLSLPLVDTPQGVMGQERDHHQERISSSSSSSRGAEEEEMPLPLLSEVEGGDEELATALEWLLEGDLPHLPDDAGDGGGDITGQCSNQQRQVRGRVGTRGNLDFLELTAIWSMAESDTKG